MLSFRFRVCTRVAVKMEQTSISKFFGSSSPKKTKTDEDAKANSNLPQDVVIEKPIEIDVPEHSLYHLLHETSWVCLFLLFCTKSNAVFSILVSFCIFHALRSWRKKQFFFFFFC